MATLDLSVLNKRKADFTQGKNIWNWQVKKEVCSTYKCLSADKSGDTEASQRAKSRLVMREGTAYMLFVWMTHTFTKNNI